MKYFIVLLVAINLSYAQSSIELSGESNYTINTESRASTFYDYAGLIPQGYEKYLLSKSTELIKLNPSITKLEINEYLKKIILDLNYSANDEKLISDYSDLIPYVANRLNEKEKEIFNNNLIDGVKVLVDGKKAIDRSKELYSSGLHNGNGDAFRHAFWNALMVKSTSLEFAEKWATAHEEGSTNQPKIERTMDLYNNQLGRLLGKVNTSKSDYELSKIIQDTVRSGIMLRIVNNELKHTNYEGEK